MATKQPTLYIFSGLPGVGKTTLSKSLCQYIHAMHLRIDTIEQALRDLCSVDAQIEGYGLAYRLAADNLRLGNDVIADSCNPIHLTRNEWQAVAINSKACFVNIEVICSDSEEHQQRVETRLSGIAGLKLPTWKQVRNREYHAWLTDRIIIDTAGKTQKTSITELINRLK
jgi:predicted kinase